MTRTGLLTVVIASAVGCANATDGSFGADATDEERTLRQRLVTPPAPPPPGATLVEDGDDDVEEGDGDAEEQRWCRAAPHHDWLPHPDAEPSRDAAMATCQAVFERLRGSFCLDGCACDDHCFANANGSRLAKPLPPDCGCFGQVTVDAVCEHLYEGDQIGRTSPRALNRCLAALSPSSRRGSPTCAVGDMIEETLVRYPSETVDDYGPPDPAVEPYRCRPCDHLGVVAACLTDPEHCPLIDFRAEDDTVHPRRRVPEITALVEIVGTWTVDVDDEVRSRLNEIRSCYNAGLRHDGDLGGSIEVDLACRPSASQAVASKRLEAAGVRRCVELASRGWLGEDSCEGTALAHIELQFAPDARTAGSICAL